MEGCFWKSRFVWGFSEKFLTNLQLFRYHMILRKVQLLPIDQEILSSYWNTDLEEEACFSYCGK